jgi:hypothetical protein
LSIPILRNEVKLGGREWSIDSGRPGGLALFKLHPEGLHSRLTTDN